uniref:Fungal N-terminal domain-containing protein n=1 Tax=Mycena chlorophos TaxID=658473 RepID=A0ABQ0M1K4_MYCCL|nr:predicted protein [Mycena chlorophos]
MELSKHPSLDAPQGHVQWLLVFLANDASSFSALYTIVTAMDAGAELKESREKLFQLMSGLKGAADEYLALARKLGQEAEDIVGRFARDILSCLPVLADAKRDAVDLVADIRGGPTTPTTSSRRKQTISFPTQIASPPTASPQEERVAQSRHTIRSNLINNRVWPVQSASPWKTSSMGPPPITPVRLGRTAVALGNDNEPPPETNDDHDGFSSERMVWEMATRPARAAGRRQVRTRQKGAHATVPADGFDWVPMEVEVDPEPAQQNDVFSPATPSPSSHRPFQRTHSGRSLSFGTPLSAQAKG